MYSKYSEDELNPAKPPVQRLRYAQAVVYSWAPEQQWRQSMHFFSNKMEKAFCHIQTALSDEVLKYPVPLVREMHAKLDTYDLGCVDVLMGSTAIDAIVGCDATVPLTPNDEYRRRVKIFYLSELRHLRANDQCINAVARRFFKCIIQGPVLVVGCTYYSPHDFLLSPERVKIYS